MANRGERAAARVRELWLALTAQQALEQTAFDGRQPGGR